MTGFRHTSFIAGCLTVGALHPGVIRKSLMSELNTRDERALIKLLAEGSASTRRSIRR